MILDIIKELSSESSTNGKIEILKKYKDNELLQNVLIYSYSPLFNYYIKKIDIDAKSIVSMDCLNSLISIFSVLDDLNERKYTGNEAKDLLHEEIQLLHFSDRVVVKKIIERDLDCGINVKTINKVWPNLIPSIPYMRCSLVDKLDRIKYPAIIQQKADGLFVNVVIKSGDIKFFTRNGTEFDLNHIKNALKLIKWGDYVLHGELLVYGPDNRELSRKEGNGLINSLIKRNQTIESLEKKIRSDISPAKISKIKLELSKKREEYKETDSHLKLVLWDSVPYEDWVKGEFNTQYSMRFHGMEKLIEYGKIKFDNFTAIKLIESKEVNSIEEAMEFYEEQIKNGYEGAVLKNKDGNWKNHTSPNQIKLKGEKECELKIRGYEHGTGKYIGGIGAFICESSDRRVVVNVGSGLSDFERGFKRKDASDSRKGIILRDDFDCNCYDNTIITVKYNELIESKTKDTYSLFLPRVVELNRKDKNEADVLETIKKG